MATELSVTVHVYSPSLDIVTIIVIVMIHQFVLTDTVANTHQDDGLKEEIISMLVDPPKPSFICGPKTTGNGYVPIVKAPFYSGYLSFFNRSYWKHDYSTGITVAPCRKLSVVTTNPINSDQYF
jgi:hypothetical protein